MTEDRYGVSNAQFAVYLAPASDFMVARSTTAIDRCEREDRLDSAIVARLAADGLPARRRRRDHLRPTEPARVDPVLPHLVAHDPLGSAEQPRRLRAVPARALERVDDQVLLVLP